MQGGGGILNSKSEITRGGKIPRLVIMVGDKLIGEPSISNPESEPDSYSSPDTVESSLGEFVSDSVRRTPAITFSSHSKRLGQDGLKQSLIQPLLKRMKMTGNLAKRKRCIESDDNQSPELEYQNDTHFVHFDKFGKGIITSNGEGTGQVLVDQVGNSNSNSKVGSGGGGKQPCDSDSGAPVIKQVTTEAFLSGGTSPKNYEGCDIPYRGLVMRANVPEG
jgi:hypothetical protein